MTATTTKSDTDLDMSVLDALDFKEQLLCENVNVYGVHCKQDAEWIVRHKCCDATKLLCNFHKDLFVYLASTFKVNHVSKYGGCGKIMELKSIDRI